MHAILAMKLINDYRRKNNLIFFSCRPSLLKRRSSFFGISFDFEVICRAISEGNISCEIKSMYIEGYTGIQYQQYDRIAEIAELVEIGKVAYNVTEA